MFLGDVVYKKKCYGQADYSPFKSNLGKTVWTIISNNVAIS